MTRAPLLTPDRSRPPGPFASDVGNVRRAPNVAMPGRRVPSPGPRAERASQQHRAPPSPAGGHSPPRGPRRRTAGWLILAIAVVMLTGAFWLPNAMLLATSLALASLTGPLFDHS